MRATLQRDPVPMRFEFPQCERKMYCPHPWYGSTAQTLVQYRPTGLSKWLVWHTEDFGMAQLLRPRGLWLCTWV